MEDKSYGKELILDLHDCDPNTFTRGIIEEFLTKCCQIMGVQQCDLYFWDDFGVPLEDCQTDPETKGTTAIQFLLQSNITIHTLDLLKKVFINCFSCKPFDRSEITVLSLDIFGGVIAKTSLLERI